MGEMKAEGREVTCPEMAAEPDLTPNLSSANVR